MPYKQEDDFKMLKNRTLGIAFNTSEGQTFTFHDLNSRCLLYTSDAADE